MKKALIFSLILHLILFSLAFFLKDQEKKPEQDYFYTRIITPDELRSSVHPPHDLKETKKLFDEKIHQLPKTAPNRSQSRSRADRELPKGQKQQTDQYSAIEKQQPTFEPSIKKDDLQDTGTLKKKLDETPTPRTFDKFDKEIIGKLAQKERDKKPDSSITFSTKEYRYQGYMQRLKEKIEGIWKYPIDAAQRGIYGDLYIKFTIKKDGRLGAVDLIRTSGYKSLDTAALRALRDAEPYWPLPDEWGIDGLTITGHFVYTHFGGYIR